MLDDKFGHTFVVHGTQLFVGSFRDRNRAGAAYLFDGPTGALFQTFVNPNPVGDDDFFGEDFFGQGIAFDGPRVVVGAPAEENTGAVYVFDATSGLLERTIRNPTPGPRDFFGANVAAVGGMVLVSATLDDTAGPDAGAVYAFDAATGELVGTALNPSPATQPGFGAQLQVFDADTALLAGGNAIYFLSTTLRCGDGVLDAGEECDDGNEAGDDGCSRDCRLEPAQHLRCYQARSETSFTPRSATAADPFGTSELVVEEPVNLCVAVDVDGTGVPAPTTQHTCYRTGSLPGAARFRRHVVDATDSFGPLRLDLKRPDTLCVPVS